MQKELSRAKQEDVRPEEKVEDIVVMRLLRLNSMVQGIATGLVLGLAIFVATNWLILKGGDVVGPHLALLGQFFIGYEVTFVGSLIGLAYGFGLGFVVGYLLGHIYNGIVDWKESKKRAGA